jgi:hypothetical protein
LTIIVDPYLTTTQVTSYKPETLSCFTVASAYINGTCIKTVYYLQNDQTDLNNYKENLGVLSFPSAFYNSKCIPDSPVKYLYDKPKSFCNTAIDQVG